MSRRSPARFLAPLALVSAAATIYLVARTELDSSSGGSKTTSTSTSKTGTAAAKTRSAARRTTRAPKAAPKTYTVKPGDVLGSIADATGVPVSDLLDYNDVDAQSLRVGQKLKLTP